MLGGERRRTGFGGEYVCFFLCWHSVFLCMYAHYNAGAEVGCKRATLFLKARERFPCFLCLETLTCFPLVVDYITEMKVMRRWGGGRSKGYFLVAYLLFVYLFTVQPVLLS